MTLGFMDASVGPLRVCDGVLLAGARGCCVERSRRECDAACVPDRAVHGLPGHKSYRGCV